MDNRFYRLRRSGIGVLGALGVQGLVDTAGLAMARTVCIVVRNAGVECSFSAYVASANRVFEPYNISRTRCQFVANGSVTQKVVDKPSGVI